jgi:hypothetical protein
MNGRAWFLFGFAALCSCGGGSSDPDDPPRTDAGGDTSVPSTDAPRIVDDGGNADDLSNDVVKDAPSSPSDSQTDSPATTPDVVPTDALAPKDSPSTDSASHDVKAPSDAPTDTLADADVSADSPAADSSTTDAALSDAHIVDAIPDVASDAPPYPRRIPLPCDAPLPTGFCLISDPGDYPGGGKSYTVGGANSVRLSGTELVPNLRLYATDAGYETFNAQFAPPDGADLTVGLYDPAKRYPFHNPIAGLSVTGGGGCNTITGKFAVEEFGTVPQGGVSRISVTFEQHCEGAVPALRGVINYQATGHVQPPIVATKSIALNGKISRLTYDATNHIAYGLDAANRAIAKIHLASGAVTYTPVVQVPNDACVDLARGRLFVVNKGSAILSEYKLDDLSTAREITWAGLDNDPAVTHFHIYCTPSKLYVVDGAWTPGLFTVEDLDAQTPTVTDRTSTISGVGGMAFNSTFSDFYYWYQLGWGAGSLNTSTRRVAAATWMQLDQSTVTTAQGYVRDPLDAPLLLDETRNLIFSKNIVFDSTNLTRRVFTLPGSVDSLKGAQETTYALHAGLGRIATRRYVYELSRYDVVSSTLTRRADQMFFDRDGLLWYLTTSQNRLEAQAVP